MTSAFVCNQYLYAPPYPKVRYWPEKRGCGPIEEVKPIAHGQSILLTDPRPTCICPNLNVGGSVTDKRWKGLWMGSNLLGPIRVDSFHPAANRRSYVSETASRRRMGEVVRSKRLPTDVLLVLTLRI